LNFFFLGQPTRIIPDTSSNLIRSSSYESIHRSTENEDKKRQIKSRNRACNESFRQAVDKSYGRNNHDGMRRKKDLNDKIELILESVNGEKSHKTEKQKFKFSNLFTTK
jgi:hypothetical protein